MQTGGAKQVPSKLHIVPNRQETMKPWVLTHGIWKYEILNYRTGKFYLGLLVVEPSLTAPTAWITPEQIFITNTEILPPSCPCYWHRCAVTLGLLKFNQCFLYCSINRNGKREAGTNAETYLRHREEGTWASGHNKESAEQWEVRYMPERWVVGTHFIGQGEEGRVPLCCISGWKQKALFCCCIKTELGWEKEEFKVHGWELGDPNDHWLQSLAWRCSSTRKARVRKYLESCYLSSLHWQTNPERPHPPHPHNHNQNRNTCLRCISRGLLGMCL